MLKTSDEHHPINWPRFQRPTKASKKTGPDPRVRRKIEDYHEQRHINKLFEL